MQGNPSSVVVLVSRPTSEICATLNGGGRLNSRKSTSYGIIPEYGKGASAQDVPFFIVPCAVPEIRIINSNFNFYEQNFKF